MAKEEPGVNNPKAPRFGRIEIKPGEPIRFVDDDNVKMPSTSGSQRDEERILGATLKAYRDAAQTLLSGRYKDLSDLVPKYLKDPGDITILRCHDGIVVRYDRRGADKPKVRSGSVDATLAEIAPGFSEGLVHFPKDPDTYALGESGMVLQMGTINPASGVIADGIQARLAIYGKTEIPAGTEVPPPPHRPMCLVSVANEFEIILGGEMREANPSPGTVEKAQEFVTRSMIELPVGWAALEFYSTFDPQYWKPELAPLWAETDLLAAAARMQFRNGQFASIDPHTQARKKFESVIAEFETLLDGPEEPAHQFLKRHPELLSPTHKKVWSKLPLGDRITDFVFCGQTEDYLLVEIESPLREIFRRDGQQREELTHAIDQITDWRISIENNLQRVQQKLGLTGISVNPESLVVIGRSSGLTEENRRKLVTIQNQNSKLRIMTYDDVIQNARAVAQNLFGTIGLTGPNVEVYLKPVSS